MKKEEQIVLKYLLLVCLKNRSNLIFPQRIYKFASKRVILSLYDIDTILKNLRAFNYIDFVAYKEKKGYYYSVRLNSKAQRYLIEKQKSKQNIFSKVLQTICLAGFVVTIFILIKTIFGG